MEDRIFTVRAFKGFDSSDGLATGIQVKLHPNLSYKEAYAKALEQILPELCRYFVDECISGVGFTPDV